MSGPYRRANRARSQVRSAVEMMEIELSCSRRFGSSATSTPERCGGLGRLALSGGSELMHAV